MIVQPSAVPELLGQRIARHRTRLGWTQSDLADRLAASRVAVSHFEAGLAIPSERTIVLLAGLFGIEPPDLVDGSDYPAAKAERLPLVACRYTEADMQIALLRCDLDWLSRPGCGISAEAFAMTITAWYAAIDGLLECAPDRFERAKLLAARDLLGQADERRASPESPAEAAVRPARSTPGRC